MTSQLPLNHSCLQSAIGGAGASGSGQAVSSRQFPAKYQCLLSFIVLLLITYYLLPITPCSAQEPRILPQKDAYVDSANPDKNFGLDQSLRLGFTHSSKIAFLKFDLSSLSQAGQPKKAFLNLELTKSSGEQKPIEAEILLASSDWEENDINWNNKPSLYKTELTILLEATPGAQKLDITPIVHQWLDGTAPNHGLALFSREETFEREYLSKESEKKAPNLSFAWGQAVGGVASSLQSPASSPQSEVLFLEESQEATESTEEAASPQSPTPEGGQAATSQGEEKKELETGDRQLGANIINSKNILILALGLLALLTVAGEKVFKRFKKEENPQEM